MVASCLHPRSASISAVFELSFQLGSAAGQAPGSLLSLWQLLRAEPTRAPHHIPRAVQGHCTVPHGLQGFQAFERCTECGWNASYLLF